MSIINELKNILPPDKYKEFLKENSSLIYRSAVNYDNANGILERKMLELKNQQART